MNEKQKLGSYGEKIASDFLEKENHKIIDRNFRCYRGEIDIIAYDMTTKELVFVEVKTRRNFNYGIPAESVTKKKLNHIRKTIEYYLYKNEIENVFIRVDIIEIVFAKKSYKLNHLKKVLE